jgi:hypothetical protein
MTETLNKELAPQSLHDVNKFIRDALLESIPHVLEQLLVAATQSKNLQAKVTAIRALLALAKETGAIDADPMRILMTEMAEQAEVAKQDMVLPQSLTKS